MGAHRPMLGRALVAQEDANVGATPLRVLALAVEADLWQHRVSIPRAFSTYFVLRLLQKTFNDGISQVILYKLVHGCLEEFNL